VVPLWAVHINDGVLTWPWLLGGFALSGLLMLAALPGLRTEEELPRIALLTAAFFVAALLHVKVGGVTSVHLLFNGLVGVVLGRRSALAIPVGLVLQKALLDHGGVVTLGVNTCVMTLPALLVGGLCGELHRGGWLRLGWLRALLVALAAAVWLLSLVFSVALLCTNPLTSLVRPNVDIGFHLDLLNIGPALRWTFHPLTLAVCGFLAVLAAWLERRIGQEPEFALGLLLGVLSVLATAALNAAVLLLGGVNDFHTVAVFVFLAHLPLAPLEGVVLGFVVRFLSQVKPELLLGSDREAVRPGMNAGANQPGPVNGAATRGSPVNGALPSGPGIHAGADDPTSPGLRTPK